MCTGELNTDTSMPHLSDSLPTLCRSCLCICNASSSTTNTTNTNNTDYNNANTSL